MDEISYRIRRSERARRVRVTVAPDRGVEVVLPRRAPERAAQSAVRELRPWIERRMGELERAQATVSARGNSVPYLDRMLRVTPEPGRQRVHRLGDELLVPAGAQRGPALERWYRRAAYPEIEPRLDAACWRADTTYSSLSIRGQRTRWASCSPSGAMSFNWRLLLAPEAVLDYVVWHEVCHLEVMDHSPRFWNLLSRRCPDYRAQSAWLRRHGATLVI
ncbi:MAG: M48 family metallopeptidase [Actinomycetota bacterium]|nr:M48 family metallopeptidase [Actinomycetota bacterium]